METLAILVAAGRGERMGGDRPKAFLALAGRPLIVRTAEVFDAAECVDAIIVVVPRGSEGEARACLSGVRKLADVVTGGTRRQDSVLEGLKCAPRGFDGVVLIHDGARPFVEASLIEAVVAAAREHGAALPVLPIVDTVKRVRDGMVVETLDRAALAAAQTPQGFRYSLLGRAYEEAFRARAPLTDEAMAVECIGAPVVTLPGAGTNRKLTTPEDWAWAEAEIARQGKRR